MLQEAEALIADRETDFPANLLKAREILLELSKSDNPPKETYTQLSQVLYWLGEYSENDKDKEKYHAEGVEHGKKSVTKDDSVDAHLWYAANMGSHGVVRGIMSSLFYLGDIEKHGQKALDMNPEYYDGGPLRLMGRFYHQCPGWPIGKGDLNKAIQLLEKAVAVGPHFWMNHYYLGDAYLARRKKDKAKKVLLEVVDGGEPKEWPMYQEIIRGQCKKLLTKC